MNTDGMGKSPDLIERWRALGDDYAAWGLSVPVDAPEPFGEGYAKTLASALLDESCEGGKALTRDTRAALKNLVSAP